MRLDVLQNQWLALALVGGAALVLVIALACVDTWRMSHQAPGRMPWFMILVYAATAVFAAIYVTLRILAPPNW